MRTLTLSGAAHRALSALNAAGHRGMPADLVGGAAWPERTGAVCSKSGGGDYAAQMLLGRMRKAGWCRTQLTPGSSIWEITTTGRRALAATEGR